MVKMILFLLLFPLLTFIDAKEEKKYFQYVNEIVDRFVIDMQKKYSLQSYGSGGTMSSDVEKIDVLFISYSKPTLNDARKIAVIATQELLHLINAHEKIRPYLREHPFNSDRAHVSISFRNKDDNYSFDGSIAHVSTGKDKIFYYTAEMKMSEPSTLIRVNKNNEWTKELIPGKLQEELILLTEEMYEEALQIVKLTARPN